MITLSFSFPCDGCGKCCQNLHLSSELDFLNRGDGTCINFNEIKKACSIYEDRPDICRVDIQYKKNYKNDYSWDEFVTLNLQVCEQLKK